MSITMNHTGIVVTDIDKALEFYCEGIGLEVRFQVEAGGAEPHCSAWWWSADRFYAEAAVDRD